MRQRQLTAWHQPTIGTSERTYAVAAIGDFAMSADSVSAIQSHLGTALTTYWNGNASLTARSGSPPAAAAIALINGKTFSRSGSL